MKKYVWVGSNPMYYFYGKYIWWLEKEDYDDYGYGY